MKKNNNSTLKDIILKTVFTLISTGLLTCMIFFLYKKEKYGTYSASRVYEQYSPYLCNINLTHHFEILTTKENKYYVKVFGSENKSAFGYLYAKRNTIDIDLVAHTDFSDSCLAKNFAITFLEEYDIIEHQDNDSDTEDSYDPNTVTVSI